MSSEQEAVPTAGEARVVLEAIGALVASPDELLLLAPAAEVVTRVQGQDRTARERLAADLRAARMMFEARREFDAVEALLRLEAHLAEETSRGALLLRRAQILDDELFDDDRARETYAALVEFDAYRTQAEDALERLSLRKERWRDLASRYEAEAKAATDVALRGSLLTSAAEVLFRYGGESKKKKKGEREQGLALAQNALALSPQNSRARRLLIRDHRRAERWAAAADLLVVEAEHLEKDARVDLLLGAARLYARDPSRREAGARALSSVLDLVPHQPEATQALVDLYTQMEAWPELAALYQAELEDPKLADEARRASLLQVGMLQWRMMNKPLLAESAFRELLQVAPAHPAALTFFSTFYRELGRDADLARILSDAERHAVDPAQKKELALSLARLAESGEEAHRSIETWRAALREDPNNREAREALAGLYRRAGNGAALVELLRAGVERAKEPAERERALRDLADAYRPQSPKSDTALAATLAQLVELTPRDFAVLRELGQVYERLGKPREALVVEQRLADLEGDTQARAEIYRRVARRWLSEFGNLQNGIEAFERVRELRGRDDEAERQLYELYSKRRAYRPLLDMLVVRLGDTRPPAERRTLLLDAAQCAERLDLGADALRYYAEAADVAGETETPAELNQRILDAYEKAAERERNAPALARVIELRAERAPNEEQRNQQWLRLASIAQDRLQDPARAEQALRRVLAQSAQHPKATRALRDLLVAAERYDELAELFASNRDFEGLAEVLTHAAERVEDPSRKIELSLRVADLCEGPLGAPERAFRSYERVLSVDEHHPRATQKLLQIYEKEGKTARIPRLLESLIAQTDDPTTRASLLERLARLASQTLRDDALALRAATRAFEAAPMVNLGLFEDLCRRTDQLPLFVETLARQAEGAAGTQRSELWLKLAAVHQEQGDEQAAAVVYQKLAFEGQGSVAAEDELEKILRTRGEPEALREFFEARIARANTSRKINLLIDWAELEENGFSEPARALALHERVLGIVDNHGEALRAVARLAQEIGDGAKAKAAIERDRDLRTGAARAAREAELGRVELVLLKQPREALEAATRALDLDPDQAEARQLLTDLLPVAETRAAAAQLLDGVYAAQGNFEEQANVLGILIATRASKADRVALYAKLARVHERRGDPTSAFDVLRKAAAEFSGEREVWDDFGRLAEQSGRLAEYAEAIMAAVPPGGGGNVPEALAYDLSIRVADLQLRRLRAPTLAAPYLWRLFRREPGQELYFDQLRALLLEQSSVDELLRLYEAAIDGSAQERANLLIAELAAYLEAQGRRADAIAQLERLYAREPVRAFAALSDAYERAEDPRGLAGLYERHLSNKGDLRPRLMALYARLGTPDDLAKIAAHGRTLLQVSPHDRDARLACEALLERELTPALRLEVLRLLEEVQTQRGELREVVRLLELQLPLVPDESSRILFRIAELRDDSLSDDDGAFDTYRALLAREPRNEEARGRFRAIARRRSRWEAYVETLRGVVDALLQYDDERAAMLSLHQEIADIFRHEMGRPEAAAPSLLVLMRAGGADALGAARSLEEYARAVGDHELLRESLAVRSESEEHDDDRAEARVALAQLWLEKDGDKALGYVESALELRADHDLGLSVLDELLGRRGERARQLSVVWQREELATDADVRRSLLVRAGHLAATLGEHEQAARAYRALLEDFGPDEVHEAALVHALTSLGQYREAADALERASESREPGPALYDLLLQRATLQRGHLDEPSAALETYQRILTLEPAEPRAREAVLQLLQQPGVRGEAAAMLRPLFEAEGAASSLLEVLDIQVEEAADVDTRLDLLEEAASVAERGLGDLRRAFGYATRALRESVSEPAFPAILERTTGLARASGALAEFAATLAPLVDERTGDDDRASIAKLLGRLHEVDLGQPARAAEWLERALALEGEQPEVLRDLVRLYESVDDVAKLDVTLERLYPTLEEEDAQIANLTRRAAIQETRLEDRPRAIALLEEALDVRFTAALQVELERLYQIEGRLGDVVELYEREIALLSDVDPAEGARRADLATKMGRVLEASEMDRALDSYREALRIAPEHAAATAALERLLDEPAAALTAFEVLEAIYVARGDYGGLVRALRARAHQEADADLKRELLERIAVTEEEQREDAEQAIVAWGEVLHLNPHDRAVAERLIRLGRAYQRDAQVSAVFTRELAEVEVDTQESADLARHVAEVALREGDDEAAIVAFRRHLQFAPEAHRDSEAALERIYERLGRVEAQVSLLREGVQGLSDEDARTRWLHIARLEEHSLGRREAAVAAYRACLDLVESDETAQVALTRLLQGHPEELIPHLARRVELAVGTDQERALRLELASALETDKRFARALDEYESIGQQAPYHTGEAQEARGAMARIAAVSAGDAPRAWAFLIERHAEAHDRPALRAALRALTELTPDEVERAALLRRRAEVERADGEFDVALATLADAFARTPGDAELRALLRQVAGESPRASAAWDDVAAAYDAALLRAEEQDKPELLRELGQIHDEVRDDPRSALRVYQALMRTGTMDLDLLDDMDRFANLLSDWQALDEVLSARVPLLVDNESRARTYRRIGEGRRDMLGDTPGARDAYEQALDLEPESTFTMDNLLPILEELGQREEALALYRRRIELTDPEERLPYLRDGARIAEELGDHLQALELLEMGGDAARELRASRVRVLEKLGRHEELLRALEELLADEHEPRVRADLFRQIGKLQAEQLDDEAEAVVSLDAALRSEYRVDVAEYLLALPSVAPDVDARLLPLAEGAGDHATVAKVLARLALRSEAAGATGEAVALRVRLGDLLETFLADGPAARTQFVAAVAGVTESDTQPRELFERILRLSHQEEERREADELLEAHTARTRDAALQRLLIDARRSEPSRAALALEQLLAWQGDEAELLEELARYYAEVPDRAAVVRTLRRKVELGGDAATRAALLFRVATLLDGQARLEAAAEALALEASHEGAEALVLEMFTDDAAGARAFDVLDGVYVVRAQDESRAADAIAARVQIHQRRIDGAADPDRRRYFRVVLARWLEVEARDLRAALTHYSAALREAPLDEGVWTEAKRLADATEAHGDVAGALRAGLEKLEGAPDVSAATLGQAWLDVARLYTKARQDREAEPAYRKSLSLHGDNAESLAALAEICRAPAREADLVETLRRLAKVENDTERAIAHLKEARAAAEHALGDSSLAEAVLTDALALDANNVWALENLIRLHERRGDVRAAELMLRLADGASQDAQDAHDWRERAAALYAQHGQPAEAIALLERVLRELPERRAVLDDLRGLLRDEPARFAPLLELAHQHASESSRKEALAYELVELYDGPLAEADEARRVLAAMPEEPRRDARLDAVLQKLERWGDLAELRERTVGAMPSVAGLRELAELYERRLSDTGRALSTYERVLQMDPHDEAALQAVTGLAEARGDLRRAGLAQRVLGQRVATDVEAPSQDGAEVFLLRAADLYFRASATEDAEATLLEARARGSQEAESRLLTSYESRKHWHGVADLLEQRLGRLEGDDKVDIERRLARLYLETLQDTAAAVPYLERLAATSPDLPTLGQLASAYEANGSLGLACDTLGKMIRTHAGKRSKELGALHHRLGKLWSQQGDHAQALAEFDTAFKMDPGNVLTLRDLGHAAFVANDLDRAQKTFRALLLQKLEPGGPIGKGEVFFQLGRIAEAQGDKAKATQMYERALENRGEALSGDAAGRLAALKG